jgi:O-antigen ligase
MTRIETVRHHPVGMVVLLLGFVALLAGHFTLDRAGVSMPLVNDPRTLLFWLLLVALAFDAANRPRRADATPPAARRCLQAVLLLFGYQAVTALWAPGAARFSGMLSDLVALALVSFVYWTLACWDRDRVVRMTLACFLAAGVVYFLAAASGRGHDPSGRWAALGGGANVFVRIMVLAALAAVYFYCRSGKVAWLLPVPVFLVGAVFSGSRGGIFAAVVVVVLFTLSNMRRLRAARLVPLVVVTSLAAAVIWHVLGDRLWCVLQQRFVSATFEEGYTSERDVIFRRAFELFLDYPVVGVGLDGFYALTNASFGYSYVHCLPLSVAAEGGLLGLLFLGGAFFALFAGYAAVPRRERSIESRAAAYGGIFIGIASLFSGHYYDARLMWVFLILAAVAPAAQQSRETPQPLAPAGRQQMASAAESRAGSVR